MGPEKVEYWRKRMLDRLDQFRRGYEFHFAEVIKDGVHVDLESEEIKTAMQEVEDALTHLQSSIKNAKVKEEK